MALEVSLGQQSPVLQDFEGAVGEPYIGINPQGDQVAQDGLLQIKHLRNSGWPAAKSDEVY